MSFFQQHQVEKPSYWKYPNIVQFHCVSRTIVDGMKRQVNTVLPGKKEKHFMLLTLLYENYKASKVGT